MRRRTGLHPLRIFAHTCVCLTAHIRLRSFYLTLMFGPVRTQATRFFTRLHAPASSLKLVPPRSAPYTIPWLGHRALPSSSHSHSPCLRRHSKCDHNTIGIDPNQRIVATCTSQTLSPFLPA